MLVCSASLSTSRLATALHPPRRPPRGTPRPVTQSSQAGAGALAPPSPTSCALLISSFRNDEAACSQAGGDDPRKGRDRGATPITAPPLGPPTPERRAPLGGTAPPPEPHVRPSASICGIRLDRVAAGPARLGGVRGGPHSDAASGLRVLLVAQAAVRPPFSQDCAPGQSGSRLWPPPRPAQQARTGEVGPAARPGR